MAKRCANTFSQFSIPQLQQLEDGLIGTTIAQNPHHSILTVDKYGVVVIQHLEGKNMVTDIYVARRCFVIFFKLSVLERDAEQHGMGQMSVLWE